MHKFSKQGKTLIMVEEMEERDNSSMNLIAAILLAAVFLFFMLTLIPYSFPFFDTIIFKVSIITIVVLLFLAIIPARMARDKGYSYGAFYAFGFFFFLPALIVALLVQDRGDAASREARQSATSSADLLMKYKQLLDCGGITQEEFDSKKRELLG